MTGAEVISAVRLAIMVAEAFGMTRTQLRDAMAKADAEGREFGEADIAPFRSAAIAAGDRLDESIKRAEAALGGE